MNYKSGEHYWIKLQLWTAATTKKKIFLWNVCRAMEIKRGEKTEIVFELMGCNPSESIIEMYMVIEAVHIPFPKENVN